MLKNITISIYIIFAVILISVGVLTFLIAANLFPSLAIEYQGPSMHLLQELGAAAIFIGLVFFWCAFNYRHSKPLHYLLILFFALFALVHLLDHLRGLRPWTSPVINSIPLIVLFLMLFLRPRKENYIR